MNSDLIRALAQGFLSWLCLMPALALAQQVWTNPELKAKGLPDVQYQAIGRGNSAECEARAIEIATKTYPEPSNSSSRSTYQGMVGGYPVFGTIETGQASSNPFREGMESERRNRARTELAQSVFTGCMAEKGWFQISR